MDKLKIDLKTGAVEGEIAGQKVRADSVEMGVIRTGLAQLLGFKKQGKGNADLDWEIALYQFILAPPNPEDKARAYINTRYEGERQLPKRVVAKMLGWEIKAGNS